MEIKGVDISKYQSGIDYAKLKEAGVQFAIIRAGLATSEDTSFEAHVKGCKANGIDVGYYWYSYANSVEQARKEAQACLKAIGKFSKPDYPVFFDGEENSIANAVGRRVMTDIALSFVNEIESNGYPCGIYANPDWMENRYEKTRILENADVWLAHWTWDPDKKSKYDYDQTMWQWGIINVGGIDVDANLCFVDYPTMMADWYDADALASKGKTVVDLAREVLGGLWGNGVDRKQRLINAGYDYDAVQAEVNRMLSATPKKAIDDIAVEVVRGLWGNGKDRTQRLTTAGYDYIQVQDRVNELLLRG